MLYLSSGDQMGARARPTHIIYNRVNALLCSALLTLSACGSKGGGSSGGSSGGNIPSGIGSSIPRIPLPSVAPSPSPEASPLPSVEPSPSPSPTPEPSASPIPSPTPTPSPSPEPTPTPTPTPTPSPSPEPSASPSPSPTPTPSPTPAPKPPLPTVTTPFLNPLHSNASAVTIGGACETGNTVHLAGAETLSATCVDSMYKFVVTKRDDDTHVFYINQSNQDGITSDSVTFTWHRDTIAPANIIVKQPGSNPYISGDDTITISGDCESSGTMVTIAGAASETVICNQGSFSFSVSKSYNRAYDFVLSQSDWAGNTSGETTFQWVRDNSIPETPVRITPVASPHYTNDSTLLITGTCTNGFNVALSGADSQTSTCTGSSFSFSVSRTENQLYEFSVIQTSLARISSPPMQAAWVLDTIAPNAPTISIPSANPHTSAGSNLEISGECEDLAKVYLTETTESANTAVANITCTASHYSFTVAKTADGIYSYGVVQVDRANNSSLSTSFTWIRDTSLPNTPIVASPNGNPYYSNSSSVVISGICDTGHLVYLGGADDQNVECVNSGFSFTVTKNTDDHYAFNIKQVDMVTELESAQAPFNWVRDTLAPNAVTILNPSTTPYTSSGDLTISGQCEINASVSISGSATQSTTCPAGTFTFFVPETTDNVYNFDLSQTDLAGNQSSQVSITWVRDSSLPPPPTIVLPSANPLVSNASTIRIAGGCITGSIVTVFAADATTNLTTPCEGSSYGFDISKSIDGQYEFFVKQNRGGVESASISTQWIRDTVAPEIRIESAPPAVTLTNYVTLSFSSPDSAASFECRIDSESYAACTSPIAYTGLINGTHNFAVRAHDAAGNTSTIATAAWTQTFSKTIALYHFDDAPGAFVDSSFHSGSNNNPLINNGTSAGSATKTGFGQSRLLSSGKFLSAVANASQATTAQQMTVETFAKLSAMPSNKCPMVLASKTGGSGQAGWQFRLRKQGGGYVMSLMASLDGSSTLEARSSAVKLETGSFHHLAFTWDRGSVKFYYDGKLQGSASLGTTGTAALFQSSADLRIGKNQTDAACAEATLDELRMSQIVRWNTGFTPPTTPYSAD